MANQNGTVDEQWKTLYEQWKYTVEKKAKSMTGKKKKQWTVHIEQTKSTLTFIHSPTSVITFS